MGVPASFCCYVLLCPPTPHRTTPRTHPATTPMQCTPGRCEQHHGRPTRAAGGRQGRAGQGSQGAPGQGGPLLRGWLPSARRRASLTQLPNGVHVWVAGPGRARARGASRIGRQWEANGPPSSTGSHSASRAGGEGQARGACTHVQVMSSVGRMGQGGRHYTQSNGRAWSYTGVGGRKHPPALCAFAPALVSARNPPAAPATLRTPPTATPTAAHAPPPHHTPDAGGDQAAADGAGAAHALPDRCCRPVARQGHEYELPAAVAQRERRGCARQAGRPPLPAARHRRC